MMFFKNIRFNYYLVKGEKAFKNGDEKTANICKKKLREIRKQTKDLA